VSTIIPFEFPETNQPVRVVVIDGEPWWLAGDVCSALDLTNVGNALSRLDEDEKGSIRLADGTPGNPNRAIVNEPGLYSLILRSDRPDARAFKRWVTHEVIPSIRRTGQYSARPAELSRGEILRMALAAEEEAERLRAERAELSGRVAELEPAAAAWDRLASADQDFSVREAAHILNRDSNISTGEKRLFAVLRGMGLIDRQDRPYQRHSRHVHLRPRSYSDRVTGVEMAGRPQVRVTVAGLRYLHGRLGGAAPLRFDQLPLDPAA
jgi:prophage antirepressor-like protein